jgi:hypothetical protein
MSEDEEKAMQAVLDETKRRVKQYQDLRKAHTDSFKIPPKIERKTKETKPTPWPIEFSKIENEAVDVFIETGLTPRQLFELLKESKMV